MSFLSERLVPELLNREEDLESFALIFMISRSLKG
jgi:hypothetical protein